MISPDEFSATTQKALLGWRASIDQQQPEPMREVELWRVRKEEWELRCVAVYLPSGLDVRLMEGDDFRRTRLVRDAIECTVLSDEWKQKLTAVGWTT